MRNKLLVLAVVLGLGTISASAQTTVAITYAGDSMGANYCPPPVQPWIYVYGTATGYSSGDSISVYIDFGDGHDTTISDSISQTWFWASPNHTYTAKGIYNVRYIATGPDGNADTLDVPAEIVIGDTCGNISGKTYNDMNANCVYDAGDVILTWMPVELFYNSQSLGWSYSDQNGDYFFSAPTGNSYVVKMGAQASAFGYSVSCPASGQYNIASVPSSGNDFGMTCLNGFDLQAHIYSQRFRPTTVSHIYPAVSNAYCMPVSGQAKLVIDDPRLTYVGAQNPPNQISGDTLIWNFSNLSNNNYWYWWYNSLGYVQVLTDVNAVLGDTICVTLIVVPSSGDVNPSNNTAIICREISNSLDPNEKSVSPVGEGVNGNVAPNTEFTYFVQFQNTGNDTAYNIYILDTLDADLDLSTFAPIASSHSMVADMLPGNVARFTFANIMLVDSFMNEPLSHGWVSYKISAKPGLTNGTQIHNTADIYFDFNSPVITNTTVNTIDISLGVNESGVAQNNVTVYPNPASNNILVTLSEKQIGAELSIVDALGQTVLKTKTNQQEINLNVCNLPTGIYNLIVNSKEQTSNGRLIIVR